MHAGEVSQWVVVLLGWVWLGEQGTRVGWSLASGLLPVALWWAVRMLCRGCAWTFQCPPVLFGLAGLLTASGIFLVGQLPSTSDSNEWLLCVAVLWGIWSALIETRTQTSTFQVGPVAWHPVIAGVLVVIGWQLPDTHSVPHQGVILLLVISAVVLCTQEWFNTERKHRCHGVRTSVQRLLAPSAMGLMMGSLWLNNAWCVGMGWRTEQMVVIHLSLMAGLPTLLAYVIRSAKLRRIFDQRHAFLSLALLTLGAMSLWGDGPIYSVLTMLLPSLSWAIHCTRPRLKNETVEIASPWVAKCVALLLGPVLLTWVGTASQIHGPLAIQTALAFLGLMALSQLLHMGWNKQLMNTQLSIQQSMEIPKL